MRTRHETREQHRTTIRRLGLDAFKDHVLTDIGTAGDTRVFRCARPGSGTYGFRVIASPGWLIVYGDIGDTMFRHSDRDSLAWLRGAAHDIHYMAGKIQGKREVFLAGEAQAFIDEVATGHGEFTDDKRPKLGDKYHPAPKREECESDEEFTTMLRGAEEDVVIENRAFDDEAKPERERAEKIREAWDPTTGTPDDFYGACSRAGVDDPPACTDVDNDHLWAIEALRWFIGAYDKREAAKAQSASTVAG